LLAKGIAKGGAFMVYPNKLAENIHRIILDLDYDLGMCVDQGIRQRLVKAIYALRDLEQLITTEEADASDVNKVQQILTSL
jgi:hypothetical protein